MQKQTLIDSIQNRIDELFSKFAQNTDNIDIETSNLNVIVYKDDSRFYPAVVLAATNAYFRLHLFDGEEITQSDLRTFSTPEITELFKASRKELSDEDIDTFLTVMSK